MPEPSDGIAEELERQLQLDAERQLAAAHLQPVFEPGWWETATRGDVADMWQQATSWRDPDRDLATPTVFDHAAGRIGEEVRDRTGLDTTQILALAAVQDLEHEHQTTLADHNSVRQPAEPEAVQRDSSAAPTRGYDDPHRREQLRARLVAAGAPEPAIEARTLADLAQAREAAEAARTPAAAHHQLGPPAGHSSRREQLRQR